MGTILRTRQTATPIHGADAVLSDEALAARVRNGDELAFEQLYARHHAPLRRYCASILRQPEDAEEAVQSAMMNAYLALAAGAPDDLAVRPWLYRIARNQCVDMLRRRPTQPTTAFTGREAHRAPGVAERVEMADDIRRLRRDLLALPDDQRGALVMREMAGLSHQQIAAVFDETPAGVKQLIYQARVALQSMASGRDLDCATVRDRIATGDGRVLRARDLKAHLSACVTCEGARRAARPHRSRLAALLPAGPAALVERVLSALRSLGGAGAGGATAGAGAGVLGAGGTAGLSAGTGITLGTIAAAGLIAGTAILAPVSLGDTSPPAAERPVAGGPAPLPVSAFRAPDAPIVLIGGRPGPGAPPASLAAIGALPDAAPSPAPAVAAADDPTSAVSPPADGSAPESPPPGPAVPSPAAAGTAPAAADAPGARRRPAAPGPPAARAQPPAGPAARPPGPPPGAGSAAAPRRPAPAAGPTGRGASQAPSPADTPGRAAAPGSASSSPPGPSPKPGAAAPPVSPADPATPATPATPAAAAADPPGRPEPGSSPPAANSAGPPVR